MRLGIPIAIGLMALLFLGCEPIIMMPGAALSGDLTPLPTSWEFTDEVDTFQLETRPADPYSVNIWAVAIEDTMYIVAGGGPDTTWASHIKDNPQVRLRVGKALYELTALESNTNSERDLFLAAAKKKYDFDPEGEDAAKAVLYRLVPR
jgi:hypothetical protein